MELSTKLKLGIPILLLFCGGGLFRVASLWKAQSLQTADKQSEWISPAGSNGSLPPLAGSWIWTTINKRKTTLWYQPATGKAAAVLGEVEDNSPVGQLTGYETSPDGRKLLFFGAPAGQSIYSVWTILDRRTGKKMQFTYAGRFYPMEPLWLTPTDIVFFCLPDFEKDPHPHWCKVIHYNTESRRFHPGPSIPYPGEALAPLRAYYLTYDRNLHNTMAVLKGFPGLPLDEDVENPIDMLITNKSPEHRWGGFLTILPGGSRVVAMNYRSAIPEIEVFERGDRIPVLRLPVKASSKYDQIGELRATGPNTVTFLRLIYDLKRGVGSSQNIPWSQSVHPSYFRTETYQWNLQSRKVTLIKRGFNLLKLPSLTGERQSADTTVFDVVEAAN